MQGEKIYQEKLFVSFRLSQYVPADNFYCRLKSTLDLSFIREKTRHLYGKEGQKSIDPVVFFKLMLIGYIENLNSDRRIVDHFHSYIREYRSSRKDCRECPHACRCLSKE